MTRSKKVELLPLAMLKDGRKLFRRGVAHANRPNVGVPLVRARGQSEVRAIPGQRGRPRGFTLGGARTLAAAGQKLFTADERGQFVKRIAAAPPAVGRQLTEDLRAMRDDLGAVLDDLDAPDE